MEWTESIRHTIRYVEDRLLEPINIEELSREVGISPYYLQKGFSLMTGYSIAEYARYRRLYLAALDIIQGQSRIIDIAYKYGYETPESFTKAFTRFHGMSPRDLKKNSSKMTVFLPLKIKITIQGGNDMEYVVETMKGFRVVGLQREFSFDSSFRQIPMFWDEFTRKYCPPMHSETAVAQAISRYRIGEFGICVDDIGKDGTFAYMIAGTYTGDTVPEGLTVYEFPEMTWAKFSCYGPMPGALQSVNTKIFSEWLPGNPDYEISLGANIEWYSDQDMSSPTYESAIWIPVKDK
ncbi:MAG: AraC family transcriptional regulator [Clostridiales bacterium]|nr:AraC family transcriptional regulator [Clostridiales bacterium]